MSEIPRCEIAAFSRIDPERLAGFVIDGAARDIAELEALGVPVFSRGLGRGVRPGLPLDQRSLIA